MDVEIDQGCTGSLLLLYNPEFASSISLKPEGISVRVGNGLVFQSHATTARRATLRVVNDQQELDFYFRLPGQPWQRTRESAEISGMHHNILGGFLDVRPALASWGWNNAIFRGFRYWAGALAPVWQTQAACAGPT